MEMKQLQFKKKIFNKSLAPSFELKKRRFKKKKFSSFLPNMVTVLALCCGLTAIRMALKGHWDLALIAILISGFLDFMDGRLARLLGCTSRFGAELDSFSDFVSFGISPGIIMYLKTLHSLEEVGWSISVFFGVCMALRLARFNIMSQDMDPHSWKMLFSTGVPAPAGALLCLMPLTAHLAFPQAKILLSPYFVSIIFLLTSALMISRVPTFTLKKLTVSQQSMIPFMMAGLIILACLYSFPWLTLTFISLCYLFSIPFSILKYRSCLKHQECLPTVSI